VLGRTRPGFERVQILLFGIFHLQALSLAPVHALSTVPVQSEVEHA
jgi:putative membrane protein